MGVFSEKGVALGVSSEEVVTVSVSSIEGVAVGVLLTLSCTSVKMAREVLPILKLSEEEKMEEMKRELILLALATKSIALLDDVCGSSGKQSET